MESGRKDALTESASGFANNISRYVTLGLLLFVSLLTLYNTVTSGFTLSRYAGYNINSLYSILETGYLGDSLTYIFGWITKSILVLVADLDFAAIYFIPIILIPTIAINYVLFKRITKRTPVSLICLAFVIVYITSFDLNASHPYGFLLLELVLLLIVMFCQKNIGFKPYLILILLVCPSTYFASYNAGCTLLAFLAILFSAVVLDYLLKGRLLHVLPSIGESLTTRKYLLVSSALLTAVMAVIIFSDGWIWETLLPFFERNGKLLQFFVTTSQPVVGPLGPSVSPPGDVSSAASSLFTVTKQSLFGVGSEALAIARYTIYLQYFLYGISIVAGVIVSVVVLLKSKVMSLSFEALVILAHMAAFGIYAVARLYIGNSSGAVYAITLCTILSLALLWRIFNEVDDGKSRVFPLLRCMSVLIIIALTALNGRYFAVITFCFFVIAVIWCSKYYCPLDFVRNVIRRIPKSLSIVVTILALLLCSGCMGAVVSAGIEDIEENYTLLDNYAYSSEFYKNYGATQSVFYSDIQTSGFMSSYQYSITGKRGSSGSYNLNTISSILLKNYVSDKQTYMITDYATEGLCFTWETWDKINFRPLMGMVNGNDRLNRVYVTNDDFVMYDVISQ